MVAEGYNLSFPQLGAVSNNGHCDEDWSWGVTQTGSMMLGCVSCKPQDDKGAIDDPDEDKLQGDFKKPSRKKTVKFIKFDCQKEIHRAMSYNKYATLGIDIEKEEDAKTTQNITTEKTIEREIKPKIEKKVKQIVNKKPDDKKEKAKNLVATLTKAKETHMGVCGKNAENEASTWRRISIAVDSGACDNVISPDDVPEQEVVESAGSKKGENFYSATGEPIPNLGDIKLPMIMREGTARGMLMRAAPVSKPLASVKKICQAGHTVIFDDEGSFIINKVTGEVNWMREDDGNYMLDAWVPPPGSHPESANQGFRRQP